MARLFSRGSAPRRDALDRQEHDELQQDVQRAGCRAIAAQGERCSVDVHGVLRSVTLEPIGGSPALQAELYDGTEALTLVFLGRRRIAGIEPGRRLTAHGRVGRRDGQRIIFNPRYELSA